MISINLLKIDEFASKIDVDVSTSVGNMITQVLLWDSKTFKDYSQAIDLSSLLAGTSENEVFAINAEDIGVEKITGLYFIEFTSDEEIIPDNCENNVNMGLGVVANFVPYHECLLNKVGDINIDGCKKVEFNISNCSECSGNILQINTLLSALNCAVLAGFYEDAVKYVDALDILCEICHSCPDYGNTLLIKGLGFGVENNVIVP